MESITAQKGLTANYSDPFSILLIGRQSFKSPVVLYLSYLVKSRRQRMQFPQLPSAVDKSSDARLRYFRTATQRGVAPSWMMLALRHWW